MIGQEYGSKDLKIKKLEEFLKEAINLLWPDSRASAERISDLKKRYREFKNKEEV